MDTTEQSALFNGNQMSLSNSFHDNYAALEQKFGEVIAGYQNFLMQTKYQDLLSTNTEIIEKQLTKLFQLNQSRDASISALARQQEMESSIRQAREDSFYYDDGLHIKPDYDSIAADVENKYSGEFDFINSYYEAEIEAAQTVKDSFVDQQNNLMMALNQDVINALKTGKIIIDCSDCD